VVTGSKFTSTHWAVDLVEPWVFPPVLPIGEHRSLIWNNWWPVPSTCATIHRATKMSNKVWQSLNVMVVALRTATSVTVPFTIIIYTLWMLPQVFTLYSTIFCWDLFLDLCHVTCHLSPSISYGFGWAFHSWNALLLMDLAKASIPAFVVVS